MTCYRILKLVYFKLLPLYLYHMLSISIVVVTTWKLLWWFIVYLPTGIIYNPTVSMCIIHVPNTDYNLNPGSEDNVILTKTVHVIPTFTSDIYITGGHHVGSGGLVVGRVVSLPTSQILTLGDQEIQHWQQLTTKQRQSFRVRISSRWKTWWVTSQWKEVSVKDHALSIKCFPF